MASRRPLTADRPDGVAATLHLWLIVGFMFGLFFELAVLGFDRLAGVSLVVVFAVPLAAGLTCMALVWAANRRFGPKGVVLSSWTAGGMYLGMFASDLVLRLFLLWRYTMTIVLAGMAAGAIVGLILGLRRFRAGDREVFRP